MYYQVLVDQKLPSPILTYKSDERIPRGMTVEVLLKEKKVLGVVTGIVEDQEYLKSLDSIKDIVGVVNYCLSEKQLRFLSNFGKNTFNNLNVLVDAFIQPYSILGVKDNKNLSESNYESQNIISNDQFSEAVKIRVREEYSKLDKPPKVEFIIDSNTLVRIRNIIRISIWEYLYNILITNKTANTSQEILILFPEIKFMDRIFKDLVSDKELQNIIQEFTTLLPTYSLDIVSYNGRPTKKSKDVIRKMKHLTSQKGEHKAKSKETLSTTIILGTRSSIFLPFNNLTHIILTDEANSMYIQEQNSLYFDTRDIAFIMANTFETSLSYLSTLPSIRLFSHYPESSSSQLLTDNQSKDIATINVTKKHLKHDEYNLLSDSLLTALGVKSDTTIHTDDDNQAIFS